MRCPKCHYLSFEPEPRCRNCGYDLSFEPGDVLVKSSNADEPVADLELGARSAASAPAPDSGASKGVSRSRSTRPVAGPAPDPAPLTELPLFLQPSSIAIPDEASPAPLVQPPEAPPAPEARDTSTQAIEPPKSPDDDIDVPLEPLVKVPAAPRVPLAVRRPTPAPGRVREKYQTPRPEPVRQIDLLDREPADPAAAAEWPLLVTEPAGDAVREAVDTPPPAALAEPVGAARRLQAALIDLVFIGSIDATIVWLTLQSCELTWSQIGALPILPVAALLFLLDALYLLMFTATNGQTVGKMAAGIRVVAESTEALDRVTLKQAILRAVLTFPSVLALGAGFLPALLGQGLALHDRFAHTRVVRA